MPTLTPQGEMQTGVAQDDINAPFLFFLPSELCGLQNKKRGYRRENFFHVLIVKKNEQDRITP